MTVAQNDPTSDSGSLSTGDGTPGDMPRPEDMAEFFLAHMSQHVMTKIGMGATETDAGRSMTLHPSPLVTEDDGHVDFGVLGIFFDMAASGAFEDNRGGVHADIAVTRLRPPAGLMTATARPARAGRRTGVVEVDLHDETGALVATSTQEIVFREMMGGRAQPGSGDAHQTAMDQMRDRFRSLFDGTCTLERPLGATLGIERRADAWHLALADDRTNGGGALHGGCGIALVEAAANGSATDVLGASRTLSAAVRYLAPARVGPFMARSEVTANRGGVATQRIRVVDSGQDDRAVMLADVVSVVS